MLPRLAQMPSWGKQLMKHMLTMQGTSSSGGSAEPATQQQSWVCVLQQVVGHTHRSAQHPQHKQGEPVLKQMSASQHKNVSCAAQPMLLHSGTQPS